MKKRLAFSFAAVAAIVATLQFSVFSQEPLRDAVIHHYELSTTSPAIADNVIMTRDDLDPQPALSAGAAFTYYQAADGPAERLGESRSNTLFGQAGKHLGVLNLQESSLPVDPQAEVRRLSQRNLDLAVSRLVQEYAGATEDAKRNEIKAQLAKNLEEQFTVRQQAREAELKALEDQVKKLRDLQNQRLAQKDRIVNDRLQQLLNDAQGLGWGTAESNLRQGSKVLNLRTEKWNEPTMANPVASPAPAAPATIEIYSAPVPGVQPLPPR